MKVIFRCLLVLLILCCGSEMALAQASTQERTINLYAWADYFDPAVLDDFTKETGIKIAYDTYESNAVFDARMASGKSGYDVVVISGPSLQKEIAAGLLQKLDRSKVPAARALWPEISNYLSIYDPGNLYALNYMWFTLGLTYNVGSIQGRHADMLVTSWDAIFRPEVLAKFADCGVEVQDSPNDLFAAALHYLRLDPRSRSIVDLKRAAELLFNLRRNVKKFHPAGDISDVASGDACLTLGWSSDTAQARKQARESGGDVTVDYAIPKGGTLILLDNLAIPKDAPHADLATSFINYLMRPEIAARNTKATHFANGVLASKSLLPQEIATDASIYPDAVAMKSFFTAGVYNPAEQAIVTREWTRVKTGK